MTPHGSLPGSPDELEARLVAAAVAGDEAAFASLADRHRTVLHAHCRRILGSPSDADDAVQEALLRAWRSRGRFEGRSSFGWWLKRIATNTCIDHTRRGARTPVTLGHLAGDDLPCDPSGDHAATDPAVLATTSEAVEHAYLVAVRILPARQRAALVLMDVLRYSAVDAAELLGSTVPAVNSALQRARAALDARRCLAAASSPMTAAERALVRRLVEAHHRADPAAVVATLDRPAA